MSPQRSAGSGLPPRLLLAILALAAAQPPGRAHATEDADPGAEAPSTLAGLVVDARTGAPLPFASVSAGALDLVTDEAGAFVLQGLPSGLLRVTVAAEGWRPETIEIDPLPGERIEVRVALRRARHPRNETVVVDPPPWRVSARSGLPAAGSPAVHELSPADVAVAPGGFGDPLRALQKLPGVSGDEGSRVWFQVRGGTPDEVRAELDGIEIRHLSHADGIVSVFGRDLLDSLELHSAGTPVDRPGALSGGMYASYLDGPHDDASGSADLSLLAGSAGLAVATGKDGRGAIVVGARRSFLGAYLAAAEAAGAFQGTPPRVDFGEYFGRFALRPAPGQEFQVTATATHDRLLFDDANERRRMLGAQLLWRWAVAPRTQVEVRAVHSSSWLDEPKAGAPLPHPRAFVDADHRSGLRLRVGSVHDRGTFALGGEIAARTRRVAGDFDDDRTIPSWTWLPLADLAVPALDLDSAVTAPEVALWGTADLDRVLGPMGLRAGIRLSTEGTSQAVQPGPRLELRLPLPTGTTLAGLVALVQQARSDALVVDPLAGGEHLLPERALHLQASIEQQVGGVLFLGLAGWHKRYDRLVVFSTDDPALEGHWTSDGFGAATGLEARASFRRGRIGADLAYALAGSRRTNPHAILQPEESAAAGDPRHSLRVGFQAEVGRRGLGLVAIDYSWSSGFAIGTLGAVPDQEGGAFRWRVVSLDDRRRPGLHRVAARLEQAHEARAFRLVGTAEVAATPGGAGSVEDCPSVRGASGGPPVCRSLDFLPVVMPWLGLRAEF